jgi:hypothetical protein
MWRTFIIKIAITINTKIIELINTLHVGKKLSLFDVELTLDQVVDILKKIFFLLGCHDIGTKFSILLGISNLSLGRILSIKKEPSVTMTVCLRTPKPFLL